MDADAKQQYLVSKQRLAQIAEWVEERGALNTGCITCTATTLLVVADWIEGSPLLCARCAAKETKHVYCKSGYEYRSLMGLTNPSPPPPKQQPELQMKRVGASAGIAAAAAAAAMSTNTEQKVHSLRKCHICLELFESRSMAAHMRMCLPPSPPSPPRPPPRARPKVPKYSASGAVARARHASINDESARILAVAQQLVPNSKGRLSGHILCAQHQYEGPPPCVDCRRIRCESDAAGLVPPLNTTADHHDRDIRR